MRTQFNFNMFPYNPLNESSSEEEPVECTCAEAHHDTICAYAEEVDGILEYCSCCPYCANKCTGNI